MEKKERIKSVRTTPQSLIRYLLKEKHITQNDLATMYGCSSTHLKNMLNEKYDMRVSTFIKILNLLGFQLTARKRKPSPAIIIVTKKDEEQNI